MKTLQLLVLGWLISAATCQAQDDLPANYTDGWYLTTNSGSVDEIGGVIPQVANPPVTGGTVAIAESITPDISALARNLLNDPTRIYDYVHDHIRYVHYFGSHKGAEITLLERSGNDFDQCALLVALLRAAGYSPSYEFGMVSLPYSAANQMDYRHWIGATMPNTNWNTTVALAGNININVGYPYLATITGYTNNLYFHHIWVQLSINGTNYILDPAFKIGQMNTGINLDSAAQINTNNLINDAGGNATSDYVQNLSESSIRSDLTTYSTNLRNYLQNNMPNASVQQVAGGQTIISCTGLTQPIAFTVQTQGGNWPTSEWQYIPTNLMAVLIVTLPGTSTATNIFYVPALQGDRLSLACTSSGQAQLYQEDTQLTSVQTTGSGSTFTPTLTFQHPFGSWNFSSSNGLSRSSWADQTLNQALYQKTNATYVLLYSFDANAAWLTARQRQLDVYRQEGYADTSPQVSEETLNVMGLSWLAQTELAGQMIAGQSSVLSHFLHRLGRIAEETGRGYYIDVYGQVHAVLSLDTTNTTGLFNQNQTFQVGAYFQSALEHGMIEQLQNSGLTAASTVKLLELANTNSQKIYLATSNNWTAGANVSANITSYNTNSLYNSYIAKGYYLLLPQSGSIPIAGSGSWAGSGYVAYQQQANGSQNMGMIIGGGYNGGYVSIPSAIPSVPVIVVFYESQPTFFNPQSATLPLQAPFGADPVNLVDGSFQISATDLSLGSTEPRGLNLMRYYSSARRDANLAGMSPGWLHNYYCTAATISGWQAVLGDSGTPQQMAPMLVAIRSALDIYNCNLPSPKSWTMTALIAKWGIDQVIAKAVSVNLGKDTIQFVRQPDGYYAPPANCTMSLLQTNGAYWLLERHGRTFEFNTAGLLTSIVDQYNQSLNLTYNSSNWVQTVTDWKKNRSLTFTYSGTPSRLTSVSDSTGRSVSYGYTGGDLTSFTDAEHKTANYAYDTNHQVIATYDALSRLVVTNSYDIDGRITTQLTVGDPNKSWQVYASGYNTVEIDPAGDRREFVYDDRSRLIGTEDALTNLTQTFYDGQDHVMMTVSPLNETSQYFYDGNNNLTETIDPLGFTNQFVYDNQNNLIRFIDPRGNPSTFGYNTQFSLTGSTNGAGDWVNYAYTTSGQWAGTLNTRTDSGGTTTYGYDSTYGQLNNITYPNSLGSESFVNNALGDVTSHTDVRGNATSFQYNNRRQPTTITAPTNLTTTLSYDAIGNLQTCTDARSNVSSNSWSATRHLLATTLPATAQGTPIVTNIYDNRDWLIDTLDPLKNPTQYTDDADGRLVALTDPLSRTTKFGYDADSHKIAITNAEGEVTRQNWDARGKLIQLTDGAGHISLRAYDAAGNQIILTNRNGKMWQFKYDGANRLTNTITPLGRSTTVVFNHQGLLASVKDPAGQTTTCNYDAKGRLTSRADNVGTTTYGYDANDNRTSVTENGMTNTWTFDAYNRMSSFKDVYGNLIQYRYDGNGNVTNLTYPNGKNVYYSYDSNNHLTQVKDWSGRTTTMTYDLNGRLTSITRPNGTERIISYDAAGQSTNIVEMTAANLPIALFRFNWNSAAEVQWEFAAPLPHTNTPPTRTMTYDADNQLASVDGNNVTVDLDGNLTSSPLTNDTFAVYTFDARNRLSNVGGVTNAYDAMNNRIGQLYGTNTTVFVVNPNANLPQVLERIKNGITTYYIYGVGLLYQVTETATSTNTLTYHYDYRGSTIALTDGNGNVTDRIEYSAYATTTYRAGTNDTPFLFNGRYGVMTDHNGLLYMRARYYNPYLCRFLNPDPSGFSGGLNFYAYANGNPVSYLDPFGLGANESWYDQAASWVNQQVSTAQTFYNNNLPWQVSGALNTGLSIVGGIANTPQALGHYGEGSGTFAGNPTLENSAGLFGDISLTAGAAAGLAAPFAAEGTMALSPYRMTTAGETFFHYGYTDSAASFEGGLRPGGFATSVGDLSGAEAQSGLALPRPTAPPNAVYTVTPQPGTWIRVNPVAEPLFGQPGGLPEFQFPGGTAPGTVSLPMPILPR